MARTKEMINEYPKNIIFEVFKGNNIDEEHFDLNFNRIKNTHLKEKEVFVLEEYYKYGKPLEEIGLHLGVCKERVRQIKHTGVIRLRQYAKYFSTYVEDVKETTSISVLNLEAKSYNALMRHNIVSVQVLESLSYEELKELSGIGVKIAKDIIYSLNVYRKGSNLNDTKNKYIYKEIKRTLDRYNLTFQDLTNIFNTYEN